MEATCGIWGRESIQPELYMNFVGTVPHKFPGFFPQSITEGGPHTFENVGFEMEAGKPR